jgi:predicted secreted protein
MLHRQLGGAWGFLIRRPLEAGAMTIPLMLIFFIPVLVDLEHIYPWVNHPEAGEAKEAAKAGPPTPVKVFKSAAAVGPSGTLREPLSYEKPDASGFKRWWLSPVTFTVRVAIYFTIWIVLALVLVIGSRRQDETGSTSLAYGLQSLSAPGLVLYFLTTSFALIDWGMSLEPEWYSTIYGVLIMIGQVVSTMAFMILVAAVISGRGEVEGLDKPETFNDLGNLLLAFVMLWTYISFSQFLIIWAGNLNEEIPWYIRRFHGGYLYVGQFLMLFHFAVPFLILLARPLKRNISSLWKIAALVFFAHLIEVYWLIVPSFGKEASPLRPSLLDLAAPIGIGGIWLATFLWFLKGRPLMVAHDPELLPALKQAGGH